MFAENILSNAISTEEKPKYDHGFSEEQVINITNQYKLIDSRDLTKFPTTFIELKEIVIPYLRIKRTEEFILNTPKAKSVKEPKPKKEPKLKKLSKKAIKEKLDFILTSKLLGADISEEDKMFYLEHKGKSLEEDLGGL